MPKPGSSNALKKGVEGTVFDKWLKANGINLPPPQESGDFLTDLQNRTNWIRAREKLLEGQMALYKSVNARGHTVLGQLMELEADIMQRREYLKKEGKSPIDDVALQKAEERRFEMMKFLERIKFDKEKAYAEHIARKTQSDTDGDNLFEYDPEYVEELRKDGLHADKPKDH